MKPILSLAAVGVAGVVLWKLLSILFVPLLGLFVTVLKIALVVGLAYLAFRWLTKEKSKPKDDEAPAS